MSNKVQPHRNTVERREKILEMLSENGKVLVHELSKKFDVSDVTIRNDLEQLEKKNMLIRARGGALLPGNFVASDFRITEKIKLHYSEKERIGKKAVEFIQDSETIYLDAGTTTFQIARHIRGVKNLTVISNALNNINQLVNHKEINLIVVGGYLRENSLSMVGPMAIKNINDLYVDKVFLGVDGFDAERGIYTPNMEEAYFTQNVVKNAKKVIVVTDSSKFNRKSLFFFCPVEKIDMVITDQNIPEKDLDQLLNLGIEVILV